MPTIFDFVGFPFTWGSRNPKNGFDCYTLAEYVHNSFIPNQVFKEFQELHSAYPDGNTPVTFMSTQMLLELGEPTHTPPAHLDLTCIRVYSVEGMATVVYESGVKYLVYTSNKGSKVQLLERMMPYCMGFWKPDVLVEAIGAGGYPIYG